MSGFGSTPTTTLEGTLPTNQVFISSVAEPGRANGDLTALEGGPGTVDSNLNRTAPASMYVKDGNDVTQGLKTDPAVIDPTAAASVIALLKGLLTELIDIEAQSTTTPVVSGSVSVSNFPVTQPVSATSLPLPAGAATAAKQPAIGIAGTPSADVTSVQGVAGGTPQPTQDIEQAGYIALTTPPAATTAGSDTPLTFSSQVSRVVLENHTSANVYYAFDVAASAGSLKLVPGATLIYPKKVTVVHLFTAAAQNVNGTVDGNIVVLGAL